jgi:hypothetical protein
MITCEELEIFRLGDDRCGVVDFWHRLRVPKLQSMTFHLDARVPG